MRNTFSQNDFALIDDVGYYKLNITTQQVLNSKNKEYFQLNKASSALYISQSTCNSRTRKRIQISIISI